MKTVLFPKKPLPDQELAALQAELLSAQGDLALAYRQFDQALDPELVSEVLTVIRGLAQNGMTMVMATHQMGFTRSLADEVLFMQEGRIIEQGSPKELLADGSGTRTLDFCSQILDVEGACA